MTSLKVTLTGIISSGSWPDFAQARFCDRYGKEHLLRDKLPVFTAEEDAAIPCEGAVGCFIEEEHEDYYVIDLAYPDGLEDEEGMSRFEVEKGMVVRDRDKRGKMSPVVIPAVNRLLEEYDDCVIDCHIMRGLEPYQGEKSHRDAVLFALERESDRHRAEFGVGYSCDSSLLHGTEFSADRLLNDTLRPWNTERWDDGSLSCNAKSCRLAFYDPPCVSGLTREDFDRLNKVLFPMGAQTLEVYSWSCDWSDYFDESKEWRGCLCVSVYDRAADHFVVMLASATDREESIWKR